MRSQEAHVTDQALRQVPECLRREIGMGNVLMFSILLPKDMKIAAILCCFPSAAFWLCTFVYPCQKLAQKVLIEANTPSHSLGSG